MNERARDRESPALPSTGATIQSEEQAEVAQLVEQLIRNQQVVGSSPTFGSSFIPTQKTLRRTV